MGSHNIAFYLRTGKSTLPKNLVLEEITITPESVVIRFGNSQPVGAGLYENHWLFSSRLLSPNDVHLIDKVAFVYGSFLFAKWTMNTIM